MKDLMLDWTTDAIHRCCVGVTDIRPLSEDIMEEGT